jgi:flavin reductase (DIM6/NTAB) family NADH-FMN oxidoreductase RutF
MVMDPRAFRDALGCFPTGVAVVTAAPAPDAALSDKIAGAHVGITVNSFTSVSLDPPLLLWCMDRRSQRHDIFVRAPGFTISILGTDHKEVSSRLARPGEHALDGLALLETELGPPALADSLAVFECATEKTLEGGDHTILLGRVLRFSCPAASAPLVFFRGKYSALARNG